MLRAPKTLAFVLGLASATGFAPLNLWPVTLISVAVFLYLVDAADGWRPAAARGYWFGFGHFTIGLNWIAGAFEYQDRMPVSLGYVAVVALSLYLAVYPALCAGVAKAIAQTVAGTALEASSKRRSGPGQSLGFVVTFAALWILTEWLRATMFTGFAWNPLGVVLVPPGLAGSAQWIGTYGLSGVVIAIAGVLLLFVRRAWFRAAIVAVPVSVLGMVAINDQIAASVIDTYLPNDRSRPLIRVIQPNIGQQDKHNDAYEAVNFAKLASLTGRVADEPRLILWPEAAVPDYIGEKDVDAALARDRLSALLGPRDVLLTGAVKLERTEKRFEGYIERTVIGARNSLFALDGQGRILARYDKSHLVPYGEYLPMQPLLSAIGLSRLVPGTVDFWPGPGPQSIALPGFGKLGVQICYEIVFSGQVVDRANRPDFLFNPSNDAWFGAWGPPQHLAQSRLRAIEEGVPVIRSTPTGISAVIDAYGRVRASLPYRKAGYLQTRLPPSRAPTLFSRYGNVLPLGFGILLAALGIALLRFRR